MQVLSLPASMQQELAARALRACMAAEAALASLRAECKPLQAVSPQRGLALKKNMGNAHRSLRLQIEACENFSLSATAAFKQLCDVFFNGDSGSNIRFHHTNLSHVQSPSMSSMTRLSSVAGNLDGDLPECGVWRSELDVVNESSLVYKEKEIGDTGISAPEKHSAGVQVEALERSVACKLDNEGLHSRLESPKTYLKVTNTSDEDAVAAVRRSNDEAEQDLDPTARQPPNHQDTNTVESTEFQESRIDEDSDASDSDVELNCEISSLRRNSTLPAKFTKNQHDDAAALHNKKSEHYRPAAVSADDVPCSSRTENKPTLDPAPQNFEYENHATQTGEASMDSEKNSFVGEFDVFSKHQHQKIRVRTPDGGNLLANSSSSGLLPATPPSISSEPQGRCDAHNDEVQPRDLQVMQTVTLPAQPPLPHVHACWAINEMTCTQAPIPSSSAPHFWSSEAEHNVEAPNRGHSDLHLENHNPSAVSYASTRASFTCLKSPSPDRDVPLYSSCPQFQNPPLKGGNSQQEHHHSSPAATIANGIIPEKASILFESRGDLMVSMQMKKENSFAPSNHTPPYANQNYFEEPNVVAVTPSPYTLKARSMFTRTTNSSAHKVMSDLPVTSSVQGSNEHYGTSLFAMAAAISVTPGYRRSSSGSGTMSSASLLSPYQPTAERQHKHNLVSTERPQLTQYSIYPMSTTLASSSSSSWDTTSSKPSAGCDKSSRPGGVEYYRKEFEHLQEQFPHAHGSFHDGHPKMYDNNTSQGMTLNPQHAQFGSPLPTPLSATSITLQNMHRMSCTAMPQRPQMRAVKTAMERQGGSPYNEEFNHVTRQTGAKGRVMGGRGYMQGVSGELTGYGSKVCLDSHSADDSMNDSNLSAIKFPDNCSVGGQSRKLSTGIRDLMERDLNNSQHLQELASWPGLRPSWDEGSTDGEGEKPSDCKMELGLGVMLQAEETNSDEDDDSLGTQGEWQAILGSLRKGDKSNLGASSISRRGIACFL